MITDEFNEAQTCVQYPHLLHKSSVEEGAWKMATQCEMHWTCNQLCTETDVLIVGDAQQSPSESLISHARRIPHGQQSQKCGQVPRFQASGSGSNIAKWQLLEGANSSGKDHKKMFFVTRFPCTKTSANHAHVKHLLHRCVLEVNVHGSCTIQELLHNIKAIPGNALQ